MVIFADGFLWDGRPIAKMSFVSPLFRALSTYRQSGDTKFSFGSGSGVNFLGMALAEAGHHVPKQKRRPEGRLL